MASGDGYQASQAEHIFQSLKNKHPDVQLQAAVDLQRYVSATITGMSSDAARKLWDDKINHKLFELTHSHDSAEAFGGLLAIRHLLDVQGEVHMDPRRNLFRFWNYVKHLLHNHDGDIMLEASETLGRIAESAGTTFGESFMDKEVPAALEMIQANNQERSKYVGVLILKELAHNSPAYFHSHITAVMDHILVPLRDHRVVVREEAAGLLGACLAIAMERDRQIHSPYLIKILDDAQMGLKQTQPEVVHGSLLTYRALLRHAGMLLRATFIDTADQILRYKSHRDLLIRTTVIALIPELAVYDSQTFTEHFLHKAMAHLLTQLEKPKEGGYAFIAIGRTATAVGGEIKPYLESIMKYIKEGLEGRRQRNATSEESMFECIGLLAAALGPNLTKLLHDQLDLIFACELSESLRRALVAIVGSIPPLQTAILDRLLNLLSFMLSGGPYVPLGAPVSPTEKNGLTRDGITIHGTPHEEKPERVILALSTLSSFDFGGRILNEFVRRCALPYMDSDNADVRRTAAQTCCRLFVHDPICDQSSSHSLVVLSDVLDRLLALAIADPDPTVRHTILSSLHERFDKYLAQAENVRLIFIALNDEVFENRVAAVDLIRRLVKYNPAYVMPSLRIAFIRLLTELEYSTVVRDREECTELLMHLFRATQHSIKPYAVPMLEVMLQKTKDVDPIIVANILMCLGELTYAGAEEALPHVPNLMRIIIPRLSDSSLIVREAALHTLGQVCSSTGYIITPILDHPQLLEVLGRMLRTEVSQSVRREVVKVLGIIGARDPYTHTIGREADPTPAVNLVPINQDADPPASDDYFQTVVITALIDLLKDQSLRTHHSTVVEAIMSIFKTQGLKCMAFLPQVVPAFTTVIRSHTLRLGFYLEQLSILAGIVKQHVRNFMPDIISLVTDLWENAAFRLPVVILIESLGEALDAEFRPFLPTILPLLLEGFQGELDEKSISLQVKTLDVFVTFGTSLEDYLHLVIPLIVKAFETRDASGTLRFKLRKTAVQTVGLLTKRINLSDHASPIIHPLVRVLETSDYEVQVSVLDTVCSLMVQLGSGFVVFTPTISKSLRRKDIQHARYNDLLSKLLNEEHLPREVDIGIPQTRKNDEPEYSAPAEVTPLVVNQQHLKEAWNTSRIATREDWLGWMHELIIEVTKESSSNALRSCMILVDIHPPLATELFNAAFLSCWTNLYDQYQEDLVRAIEFAITSTTTPSEVVIRLLNLADFMERKDRPLPIDMKTLGESAMKYVAYAKALHYKELEFFTQSSPAILESLISINTRLQQHDAAWGTLILARKRYDVTEHEEWYEHLGHWQEALLVYEQKAETDPEDLNAQTGRMRCLHALGEWNQLSAQVEKTWAGVNHDYKQEIAPMAAAAAWSLREWDLMEDYVTTMKADSPDHAFYQAVLSVHQNQFPRALAQIVEARDRLGPELTSFNGEGYPRAYNALVRAQMIAELEEAVLYKQRAHQPERQKAIRETWIKRLRGCQPDVDVWQRILQVRTLALEPQTDLAAWINFANLCRKSNRMPLAEKTLNSLLLPERNQHLPDQATHTKAPPHIVYAQLRFMWAMGAKEESLQFIHQFSANLSRDLQHETSKDPIQASLSTQKLTELSKLIARCYLKTGDWQVELTNDWKERNVEEILHAYYLATHFDPTWYKAWHKWAMANLEVATDIESRNANRSAEGPSRAVIAHIVQAVNAFFQSIILRNKETLQDTLRLLTLWFKFGSIGEVNQAMNVGFTSVEVGTWVAVIPQIIARIQTPHANLRQNIHTLLADIGKHHPQALIYPLTVASKSPSASRRNGALAIMDRMREHSPTIVTQALLVSHELIRVAILWHELWYEALEEASRYYFVSKDPDNMIATLEPLHDMLEAGPTTARETAFAQVYGPELREAREATRRWRTHGSVSELDKSWDIYYTIYRKLEKQIPQWKTLNLQQVSPILLKARNLDLAIPGSYQSGRPIITISSLSPELSVYDSKQRPRRLSIKGSDGRDYQYLLKGHEDLRQDERVMQFYSLVSNLLAADTESFRRHLHIQHYPVIPLAPNAGLIGLVQDVDTLHVLIRGYRDSRRVLVNIEYRLMLQMAPSYESLTLLQKIEVFEYALDNTTGQDLYRILWLKSESSEHWVERRATYTRSLAVNSMVGHILGLGDRHPSNILLERSTGMIVHIDFGDCFEVAMYREKYPEKVPFRLTRMLIQAMEVSGIEGSFRKTCEITMRVLRDNKDSLMAVLEALVYDPLISWRLMRTEVDVREIDLPKPSGSKDTHQHADETDVGIEAPARPQAPTRKAKANENEIFNEAEEQPRAQEVRNESALSVCNRVQHKLTGRDFTPDVALSIDVQVDRLIQQATAIENLCTAFNGWCAYW
ncbi:phosphatidylinositol 3-kinase [Lyophyllum atratum]|nr:phosphatidylinositol 3-kinase [Lyophyllum atratum]